MRVSILLVALGLLVVPGTAHATNLYTEDGQLFDIQDGLDGSWGTDGTLSDGTSDSYDGCYYLDVDGSRYSADSATVTMGGRQIEMSAMTMGSLSVRRIIYVPETGRSYARYLEIIENTSSGSVTTNVVISGNLGSDSGTVVTATSSGDTAVSASDLWFATTDGGSFDPPLAHVFQGSTGALRASSASLSADNLSYGYSVTIPAGGRAVIMHFAVQRTTTEAAQDDARYLIEAPDDALVGADDWIDDIVNFGVAVEGAPRVRFDGPFNAVEGEAFSLDIAVEDPEGDTATWTWDLDGDGTFGEMPGATTVEVAAGSTDGPGSFRVGVEATDGTHTAQRYRVVSISNAPPSIGTALATNVVSVGQRWTYAIGASDPAGDLDPLTYTVVRGPEDMIVDAAGVVTWTPDSSDVTMGDERVTVVLGVSDGDEGNVEQSLELQITPNRAPPQLTLLYPSNGVALVDLSPRLAVTSAIDEDFDPLTYFFELDDDEDFSSPIVSVGPLPEGPGFTAHELAEPLAPGHYFWRAWAFDGAAQGEPRSTHFYVLGDPAEVDGGEVDGGTGADAGGPVARGGCSVGHARTSALVPLALMALAVMARRRRR